MSFAQTAFSQGATQTLGGRLIDADLGEPVAGIVVRVVGVQLESVTDERGAFLIRGVPLGHAVLVAEGDTIEPVRVEVRPEAHQSPIVIETRYVSLPEFGATATIARRRPLTASTSQITSREIASVPRRNAEDALRLVPGLTLVQHGSEGKGHQFFLRGFDAIHGADFELTIEGIPINEWSNIHAQGYIDLGFIIPETIQSVEVTKGPFTLDQGAFAMAGSADYQLGIPANDRGLRTTYTIGTTNRHRGLVTYSPREGDDLLAVEAMHDDGFGMNRGIDRGVLLGRIRLLDDDAYGTLSLLGSGYLARFELPGTLRNEDVQAGRIGFYDAYDRAGDGLSARGLAAVSHDWDRGDHSVSSTVYGGYRRLELLENYTGFLVDPIRGDRRRQTQTTWSFGAKIDYSVRLTTWLALEAALGLHGDRLDQTQQHVDQQQAPIETERELQGVQTSSHARVGLRFRPVDELRLTVGARIDVAHVSVRDGLDDSRLSSGAPAAFSPRATVEWRVLTPLRLFAAYGRGFRPPEARSFTTFEPERIGLSEDVFDGGDPRMTVVDSFEVGARWIPNGYFGASVSGFASFIERETVFDHVSGVNLALNSTRRLGGELEARLSPVDWLMLHADVTYVDARFVDSGNTIPLAPWLVGGVRAVVTHNSGVRAGLRFMGLASRSLPHGAEGAPMTALDATAGYTWGWIRLDLEVENVLNQRIREGEYHYASHWRPGQEPSEIPVVHYVAGPPFNARLSLSAAF
ncbi:MAG: TonB-dependent receptor [Myxococcota bacterium]